MKKKKVKRVIRKFRFLKSEKRNTLFNFRNNTQIKGCYLTIRFAPLNLSPYARKATDCIAVPMRYKKRFKIGDVILFDQSTKLKSSIVRQIMRNKSGKSYFKILEITKEEFWEDLNGPYFMAFLDVKELNNLEFLSAMNDLKKRGKNEL